MEQKGAASYRHRRTPSSDRFLGVLSPPPPLSAGDEFNEDDVVFHTNHFSSPSPQHRLRQPERFGILAALPESRRSNASSIIQKPALASSPQTRDIPSIPKPNSTELKYSQSMPVRRFQQSAPMNVPMMMKPRRKVEFADVDHDDEYGEEVLPPHEIVARGSYRSDKTTFSVLEGAGRTLKGRDLRQVRNAVLRQTGFLD